MALPLPRSAAGWCVLVALLAGACLRTPPLTVRPGVPGDAYDPTPVDAGWLAAWDRLVAGGAREASTGDAVLTRAADGTIVATTRIHRVAGGELPRDEALARLARARLLRDANVRSTPAVTATGDVVRVRGEVASRDEAAAVVRTALGTRGARQVIARLAWHGD